MNPVFEGRSHTLITYAGECYRRNQTSLIIVKFLISRGADPLRCNGMGQNLYYYVPEHLLQDGPPPLRFRDRASVEGYDPEVECAICSLIMNQPVVDACGCTFDRDCLLEHCANLRVCPHTRIAYRSLVFPPNRQLRTIIENWARERSLLL